MLSKVLEFFRREKLYTVLTLLVAGAFAFAYFSPGAREKRPQSSAAIEEFKKAEDVFQKKVSDTALVQEYLKKHPDQALRIEIVILLFGAFFMAGLMLDTLFLASPSWRAKLVTVPAPPQTTPWALSMIFKVVIVFVAGSLLLGMTFAAMRQALKGQDLMNVFMILHTLIMDSLCVYLIIRLVKKSGGHIRDLGFQIPSGKPWKEVLFAWSAYAGVLPVFVLLLLALLGLAQLFHYEPPPHPLVHVFLEEDGKKQALITFSIVLAALIGPVFEEIFFRGFCYSILKKKFGVPLAMVLTASFFAFIHENTFAFWPIFVLGLILAYTYEKRGTLVAPIVLHMTHNSIFLLYFFTAKEMVLLAGK